jgi:hypothetical protein
MKQRAKRAALTRKMPLLHVSRYYRLSVWEKDMGISTEYNLCHGWTLSYVRN